MPAVSVLTIAKFVDAAVAVANAMPKTGDLANLTVFDGPGNREAGTTSLWIGARDPSDPAVFESGSTTRQYATLGRSPNFAQDETGSVPCVVAAWSGDDGDTGFSVNRLRAAAALDAFVDALRAAPQNPWLGVPGVLYGAVSAVSLLQLGTSQGSEVYIPFEITYRLRG